MDKEVKQRTLLSALRAGVLRLRIETGMYEKNGIYAYGGVPVEYRVCMLCDCKKVEDEIHFLCECTAFRKLRSEINEESV